MATDTAPGRPDPSTQSPPRRPGVRETMRTLAGFQKSNRGAPAYSRFVNRPVGRVFAALAYRYGLSPNGVTAVSACTTLTGLAVLFLVPVSVWTGLAVGLLLAAGYAIDSADGQVARLTGRGSIAGEWLDHSVDCVKSTLVHLSVLVALYRFTDVPDVWLLVPIAFAVVDSTLFFAYIVTDLFHRTRGAAKAKPSAHASVLRSLLTAPTDYGVLCIVFLTWGATWVFLGLYAVLLAGCAGYLVLGMPKWFGQLRALDAAPVDGAQ